MERRARTTRNTGAYVSQLEKAALAIAKAAAKGTAANPKGRKASAVNIPDNTPENPMAPPQRKGRSNNVKVC